MIPDGRAGRYPFSPGPPSPSADQAMAPVRLPQTLHVLIVQQWTETLTGPFDWADWPLDQYVFREAFYERLELRNLNDVAWVCAMVACRLAPELCTLDVQPRPAAPGGQLEREDGAKGYRCTIVAGRSAGSRLDLRRLPSGVIEFETFTAARAARHTSDEQRISRMLIAEPGLAPASNRALRAAGIETTEQLQRPANELLAIRPIPARHCTTSSAACTPRACLSEAADCSLDAFACALSAPTSSLAPRARR